jgi:hypothetical protein
VQQFQCLKDFFVHTRGKSWKHCDNWFSPNCLHTWFGISVDNLGRIIQIKLPHNHLRGTLPNSLTRLVHLECLDLSYNILSGYIPKSFYKFTALSQMNLFGNEFDGVLSDDGDEGLSQEALVDPAQTQVQQAEVYYFNETVLLEETPSVGGGTAADDNLQHRILSYLQTQNYVDYSTWYPHTHLRENVSFKVSDEWKIILVPHILFSSPELLSLCANPIVLLNKIKQDLYRFVYNLCKHQNAFVLQCLQRLWHGIMVTARTVPTEEEELHLVANSVATIILNIFHCNFMDDKDTLFRLLLPHTQVIVNDVKHWTNVWGNRSFIESAFTLLETEFLGCCLHSGMKVVFGSAHISNLLDAVFWGHVTRSLRSRRIFGIRHEKSIWLHFFGRNPVCLPPIAAVMESKSQSVRWWGRMIEHAYSIFWNPRTCPAVMFFAEALSKLCLLVLCAYVVIIEYTVDTHIGGKSSAEHGVLLLWTCSLAYEFGVVHTQTSKFSRIISTTTSITEESAIGTPTTVQQQQQQQKQFYISEYLSVFWNCVDLLSYFLIFIWALLYRSPHSFTTARICLSLASVPLSVGMLEYLSANRSLGHLVIIVIAMMWDLINFLVIYIIFIIAFGICFNGLFVEEISLYSYSSGQSILTLFSASLNNFEFSDFDTPSPSKNVVGTISLLVFVTLTSIVLINLLIARMSSTHNKITEAAVQEWSYTRGLTIQQYMLLSEKNPLCMLPAPLNILTAFFYFPLLICGFSQYRITIICSTAANIVFG